MPSKTRRIVDLFDNRNDGDTLNKQAQSKRATFANPVAPRQETSQDDHSFHDETQGSSNHSRNSNLNGIGEDVQK